MGIAVLGIGFFDGITGYNIHTHHFFRALSQFCTVVEIDLQDTRRTNQEKLKQWQQYCEANPQMTAINIHINQPDQCGDYIKLPGIHIVFTVWESTRYPASWIAGLEQADYIWAPSQWGKECLLANGLPVEKIRVVPEGVDLSTFHPNVSPLPALENYQGFKFIHIGKWEERKGSELIVRAFEEMFASVEDVYLVLLCHNPFNQTFDLDKHLDALAPNTRSRILSISPVKDQNTIASILRSCHCAVFPSAAEGWGLPIIEAMACGLVSIVTHYSGHTEYVSAATNLLLDYDLVDIRSPLFASDTNNWGQWAKPHYSHLKSMMLESYQSVQSLQVMGERASAEVHQHWGWDKAASKAVEELKNLI